MRHTLEDLTKSHVLQIEKLRNRYESQILSMRKQLEQEEARLRSRHSDELRQVEQKQPNKIS